MVCRGDSEQMYDHGRQLTIYPLTTKEEIMATTLQEIPLNTINGDETKLAEYAGKVLLVVNVASKCGLTPQYEGLEQLYSHYKDKGLVVLGFPANNFGQQEPGSNDEIQAFCRTNFSVDFPMFSKISVAGDDQHPLYAELIKAQPKAIDKGNEFRERLAGFGHKPTSDTAVLWNFEKFLIGRNGEVAARFAPDLKPDDPLIIEAIERELAKS